MIKYLQNLTFLLLIVSEKEPLKDKSGVTLILRFVCKRLLFHYRPYK